MALGSLAQRVVTALAMAAVLLPAFLLLPKAFGNFLVTAMVLAAAWEWSAFLGASGTVLRIGYVGLIAAALTVAGLFDGVAVPLLMVVALAWWAVAFLLVARYPLSLPPAVVALCGVPVLVPAWLAMVELLATPSQGRTLLLIVVAITSAADIGAYFAGRRFGRVKLAPRVSPGKTWEGVMGGLVAAVAAAVAGAAILGRPPAPAIFLGLSVAAVSVVGDLTASMFKRSAGLKDSGSLFPGHGGVLDRVDSITAAAPLFFLLSGWLGWRGA